MESDVPTTSREGRLLELERKVEDGLLRVEDVVRVGGRLAEAFAACRNRAAIGDFAITSRSSVALLLTRMGHQRHERLRLEGA